MVDQHHSHKVSTPRLVKDIFKLLQLRFANAAYSEKRYGRVSGGNTDESHGAADSQGGKNNTLVLPRPWGTLVCIGSHVI
jgi:hypothetical protein